VPTAAVFIAMLAAPFIAVESSARSFNVTISQSSIRINGVELRRGPRAGAGYYISLDVAKTVLGPPQDTYLAGLGVRVYPWPDAGIHVQEGFRGSDKGKIFKFQVWFYDTYSKNEDTHSGKFSGHMHVEGLDITPDTTFDNIRGELEKAGFEITEYPHVISAKKGGISIFTVDTTNKIERVEAWCS
jgi:hypothetical protein